MIREESNCKLYIPTLLDVYFNITTAMYIFYTRFVYIFRLRVGAKYMIQRLLLVLEETWKKEAICELFNKGFKNILV